VQKPPQRPRPVKLVDSEEAARKLRREAKLVSVFYLALAESMGNMTAFVDACEARNQTANLRLPRRFWRCTSTHDRSPVTDRVIGISVWLSLTVSRSFEEGGNLWNDGRAPIVCLSLCIIYQRPLYCNMSLANEVTRCMPVRISIDMGVAHVASHGTFSTPTCGMCAPSDPTPLPPPCSMDFELKSRLSSLQVMRGSYNGAVSQPGLSPGF
jgi:hypothetical protein